MSPRPRPPYRWLLVGLSLAAVAPTAGAAPAEPAPPPGMPGARRITLAEAQAYARAHQPAVRAALAQVQEERANADVPRARYRPQVGITAQLIGGTANNTTASYLNTPFVDLPRIGGTPVTAADGATWKPYASTLAAVGGAQEIFDFGRIAAEAAAADARADVAGRAAEAVSLDIEL